MSDERIVEVIAATLQAYIATRYDWREEAEAVLAALRAEGWELYRPDKCEEGQIDGATFSDNPPGKIGLIVLVPARPVTPDTGTYRLVPVPSDPPEGP